MTTIVRTEFSVVATDTEYGVPGDWTVAQLVQTYGSQVPGIGNMTADERVENRAGVGAVKVITFKPRTGTKG